MPYIHEVATITSKGQITLPKPIRQALGVSVGEKIAFDLRGTEVVVTRAGDTDHADPAITAFLSMLERDITSGSHVSSLPDDLNMIMLENLNSFVELNEEIIGDIEL